MASRTPERVKGAAVGTLVPTGTEDGPGRSLRMIQRDIEMSRNEIAAAFGELEAAAKELVTVEHWKGVAKTAFARKPVAFLAVAFGIGFIAGRR